MMAVATRAGVNVGAMGGMPRAIPDGAGPLVSRARRAPYAKASCVHPVHKILCQANPTFCGRL